jgi:hypothetical protein
MLTQRIVAIEKVSLTTISVVIYGTISSTPARPGPVNLQQLGLTGVVEPGALAA